MGCAPFEREADGFADGVADDVPRVLGDERC